MCDTASNRIGFASIRKLNLVKSSLGYRKAWFKVWISQELIAGFHQCFGKGTNETNSTPELSQSHSRGVCSQQAEPWLKLFLFQCRTYLAEPNICWRGAALLLQQIWGQWISDHNCEFNVPVFCVFMLKIPTMSNEILRGQAEQNLVGVSQISNLRHLKGITWPALGAVQFSPALLAATRWECSPCRLLKRHQKPQLKPRIHINPPLAHRCAAMQ